MNQVCWRTTKGQVEDEEKGELLTRTENIKKIIFAKDQVFTEKVIIIILV